MEEGDFETNYDFYEDFLRVQQGSDENPSYEIPVSDYGLKPLWELAEELVNSTSYEESLVIVDQMLNVIHQRGDLASLFVEGGIRSLAELSS